jgi:diketogulonate reductase-like aldo/keto reductase
VRLPNLILLTSKLSYQASSECQGRIAENFNIFDFELSPEDMPAMAGLERKLSSFLDHRDPAIVKW